MTWGDPFAPGNYGADSSAVASQLSSGVSQIFSTDSAFAALKGDGSVVTWGYQDWGGNSSAVANHLRSGVSQIFSTVSAFAALKTDGTVVTWGNRSTGGDSSAVASGLANVVAFANPFTDDRLTTDGFTPGPTTLNSVTLGSTYLGYAIRASGAAPLQVTDPGGNASASNPGNGWAAVAAAPWGSGYAFYWRNSSTGQTARWDLNSSGAYTNGSLLSGSQLISEEASLGFDLNGDGFVTNPLGYALPTSNGATIQVTYPGGNAPPSNPGNLWSAVAARTSGSGYAFYWRNSSSQQVARWELNSSAAYTSGYLLSTSQLFSEEASLNVDINGDGTIAGTTTLNGVNLGRNAQGVAIVVGNAPPLQVTYPGGIASDSNPGNGWTAVAASTAANGGFTLYWRNSNSGQTARWELNSTAAYTGGSLLSASQLLSEEANLNFDLNDDGYTSGPRTIQGVNLGRNTQGYAVVSGSGAPLQVTYPGGIASANNPGNGWSALAAAPSGGGFGLYWSNSGTGQSARWALTSAGAYQSGALLSASELIAEEVAINADLNGDSIIGQAYTTIASMGNATLLRQADGIAVVRVGADQFSVTSPFGLGTGDASSDWQMLAAETMGGQNQILWRNNPVNFYHVWTLNSSWGWQSSSGNFAPSFAATLGLETNFQLDLNGNGVIG